MARIEWRQACFELISAGHSYAEVAKQLMVSERGVRRDVARVIDERRLDAPQRHIHLQVDFLAMAKPAKPTASKAHEGSSGIGAPFVISEISSVAPFEAT
jgi:hypothetical protein